MEKRLFFDLRLYVAAATVCAAVVLPFRAFATPDLLSVADATFPSAVGSPFWLSVSDTGVAYLIGNSNSTAASLSADGTVATTLTFVPTIVSASGRNFVASGTTLYIAYSAGINSRVVKRSIDGTNIVQVATGSVTTGSMNISMSAQGLLYLGKSSAIYVLNRADMSTIETQSVGTQVARTLPDSARSALYYISTSGNLRKLALSATGGVIKSSETSIASSLGNSLYLAGLELDSRGNVYVAMTNPDSVRKFSSGGTLLWSFTPDYDMTGMAIRDDVLYVVDDEFTMRTYDIAIETPSNFAASADGRDVTLSWDAPTSPYGSTIIRRGTTGYPSSVTDGTAVASGVTDTSYVDEGLASGTTYYYSAFHVFDGDGTSAASHAVVDIAGESEMCSPLAHWTFDALSPLAEDATGNGYDGAAYGSAPTLSTDVPDTGLTNPYSYAFVRASSQGIEVPRPVQSDFTVCAWIKTTAAGNGTDHWLSMPIFESETPFYADEFGFGVDSNGKLVFGNSDDNSFANVTSSTTVNTGEWVHACATRRRANGAMAVYVNGAVDGTGTGVTTVLADNADALIGAGSDGGAYWNGLIDDVRAYDVVLAEDDIAALANGTACVEPSSSSSSSPSSSSSLSAVERQGTGGGRHGRSAPAAIVQALQTRAREVQSSPQTQPSTTQVSRLEIRTCGRVMKWFGGNAKALARVNARLRRWLGFECS